MTATTTGQQGAGNGSGSLLELRNVSKFFGSVNALNDISTTVNANEVTCILGDNGAGKSTPIKILAGVHEQSEGEFLVDGEPVRFSSPRDALHRGIATVYQDLALVPLMSIWRNFFLGSEPTSGVGLAKKFDVGFSKRTAKAEMGKMGIDVRDPDQPVGTLSGGERQSVAIARAVYFGARVLILDEPTSSLGVKQAGVVLRYIVAARDRGLGVVFITHNPHHAYPVGDRFLILNRGQSLGTFPKAEISREELTQMMAGGAELEQLTHELEHDDPDAATAIDEASAAGGACRYWHVDVTLEDEVRAAVAEATTWLGGGPDILLHLAGILEGARVDIADFPEATWDDVVDVNLKGSFLVVKHVAPRMQDAGAGVIVLTASGAGVNEGSSSYAYGSSKGGVHGLAMVLRQNLADQGVRVYDIAPGNVVSPLKLAVIEKTYAQTRDRDAYEAEVAGLVQPEGIANVFAWLASDDAAEVTGTIFTR